MTIKNTLLASTFFTLGLQAVSAESFVVDKSKSSITISAKATGDSFGGTLKDYSATITGNADTLEAQSAVVSWKFSDLDTGKADRDAKMLDWLEVGSHPKGTFTLTKLNNKGGNLSANGTLNIHGVSQNIVFPVRVTKDGKSINISGTATLNTTNYGLPIIKMLAVMKVDPKVVVNFSLTGTVK